jgi:Ca-activated chloride channel family protein
MLRLLAASCVIASLGVAHAGELPRAIGMYTPTNTQLALVDSKIEVYVRGPIIEAVVTQKFVNKTDKPTEATYVFPLPLDAAVSAMSIDAGNKRIHASIERREQAQQRYENAVRAGVAGALLDQERPDVFTQTVAAVPAKGTVAITLRFDTVARYQDGIWELVLPLVVAPRFVPGAATNRPTTGTGRAPDTARAPDASRITPGGSPGAGGATDVMLKFAERVTDLTSPTHELKIVGASEGSFTDPKTDHDAIVRWKSPASTAGWVEHARDGGYAAIVVEAPAAPARRGPVRWTLVLDRSATSRGDAEATARPFVRGLFAAMSGSDRVAVTGSDQIAWGMAADVARTVEGRWSSKAGAFDLTRVLQNARPEGAPLLLVSGGLVADDRAAVAAAAKVGVPIHVIGVGPAPARALLTQIAAASGGTVRFAITGDDVAALAKATLIDLATPPAPLSVTWGTLAASDVVPGTLPRLGAGQAIIVLARVKKVQLANGRARGELFAIETLPNPRPVEGATTAMGPLARRWARNRLDELVSARATPQVIATHALRYGLVSPQTSMVAVGDAVIVQGGVKRSVAIPVSVPAGMKWQQVKKETTVDRTTVDSRAGKDLKQDSTRDKVAKKPEDKPRPTTVKPTKPTTIAEGQTNNRPTRKPPVKKPAPPPPKADPTRREPQESPPGAGGPRPQTGRVDDPRPAAPEPTGAGTDSNDDKPKKRKSVSDDEDASSARDDDGDGEAMRPYAESPSPKSVALGATMGADVSELMSERSGVRRRRWRIAASAAGGFVRSGGESVSLLTGGARLELGVGRRLLAGVEGSLWLVDGDTVVGQSLASVSVLGIQRWLELGLGFGFQFGDAIGPAASASLRFHLPPAPRASLFLRYDGALLYENDDRRRQSSLTFGVEWGF